MHHSTDTSVPSHSRESTSNSHRPNDPGKSLEDSNLKSQSRRLLRNIGSFQDPAPRTGTQFCHCGYEQDEENLMVSTERSSSTCVFNVPGNHCGGPNGVIEPRTAGTPSFSSLTGSQEQTKVAFVHDCLSFFKDWRWETLSIVTSLGLLIGVFVTLAKYNHGEQPKWPYNVNINSLISILTAMIIAQLGFILTEIISQVKWSWFREPHPLQDLEHYDAASRGILASILFMGRFARHPQAYVAVGASFIFLMSATIGPFTQQSVKSYTCQRPLHNISATIAAASYVAPDHIFSQVDGLNQQMRKSVLEGIVGLTKNSRMVPFDCPTGNCDFAPYSSLGFCSSCSDVTSHVHEEYGPRYSDPDVFDWNYTFTGPECQLSFEARAVSGDPLVATDKIHLVICRSNGQIIPGYESFTQTDDLEPLTRFTILSMSWANCSSREEDYNFRLYPYDCVYPEQLPSLANQSGLVAMDCKLELCVKDYTGRVRNGVLDETITSRLTSHNISDNFSSSIPRFPCIIDSKNYDISNVSQVPRAPGRNFTSFSFHGQIVAAPQECIFETTLTVLETMRDVLLGDVLQMPLEYLGEYYTGPICSFWGEVVGTGPGFCNPWYLERLIRNGMPTAETISSDMDSIADAITNRMRTVGSNVYRNGSGVATGTVIQTTVCMRVEWPWLVLPAALVLFTAVLFVAVLIMARRSQIAHGQPIWKSSAVVGFFHDIDAQHVMPDRAKRDLSHPMDLTYEPGNLPAAPSLLSAESHRELMSLESMHAKAKKVIVKLETAAKERRGFIMVNEEEDSHGVNLNNLDSQRPSTDSHRDGETLPLTQLPSNSSPRAQAQPYLQVDLGVGLTPSICSSLDGSTHCGLEAGTERES